MDKQRDVRRGDSGFSISTAKRHIHQQSEGHKLLGVFNAIHGDLQFSEKPKKEKVRSLSAVGRALSSHHQHCEMGCHLSGKGDALSARSPSSGIIASKKFNIPQNFFNDYTGVDQASVPRKLRSAMKKRRRESISPDTGKVNHKINRIESPQKDSIKKSRKQGRPKWSPNGVSGPITKDEEEVAETLYALAGMFLDNASNNRREPEGESLPESSSVLKDLEENANAAFEASGTAQEPSPFPERLPREAAQISSLDETISLKKPDLPESSKFFLSSHSTTPKIKTTPMMIGSENGNKIALLESQLCLATGLNVSGQSQISHIERKTDVEFATARGVDCKQEQNMIRDEKENESPALWPGLSPVASKGIHASYLQSSTKAPEWLNAAICASKQDLMESCSGGKISKVVINKRSWKRCSAHVHISHLIRNLEMPKRLVTKESELYVYHKTKAHVGSKASDLKEEHIWNGMRNEVTSAPGTGHYATVRNPHETKNGILQQQSQYYDITKADPTPRVYAPQKQVPYFQSLAQQDGVKPIPTPHSQYGSPYLDQLSVAGPQVRLQQPHYYGSQLRGSHYSSTISNKQPQQNFWVVQLAGQGSTAENCNIIRTQYCNWQSGRYHPSVVGPCAQAILPRSPATLELLGSKISSMSGQQQQLIAPIQDKLGTPPRFCM